MIRSKTFATCSAPHRLETKLKFNLPSRPSVLAVACVALLAGMLPSCASSRRNQVVTVPGETVPHKIQKGQPSEYDGWVLPTPLFNELAPCFKKVLESGETIDEGDVIEKPVPEKELSAPEPEAKKPIPLPLKQTRGPTSSEPPIVTRTLFCVRPEQ